MGDERRRGGSDGSGTDGTRATQTGGPEPAGVCELACPLIIQSLNCSSSLSVAHSTLHRLVLSSIRSARCPVIQSSFPHSVAQSVIQSLTPSTSH